MKLENHKRMKTKRFYTDCPNTSKGKVALTVSAAALMLGASQAATVGFNFTANYCSPAAYSGAKVTASAFGVPRTSWESLTLMDTGYGCAPGYYTLSQTIDTGTPPDFLSYSWYWEPWQGLNPLPNGSVTVTWSAYTANVSGFGGYDRSPPDYSFFPGNDVRPGNEQVYWGFLRDGVNFGPGSNGGDNNQPGYSIDITGLKSLFNTTPFAVQLIASSDSMQYLTNAFIIDVAHSITHSVSYPSTPPVSDKGDTAWVRGIGGGLSTATGALDTDHLQIVGNRATHAGDKVTGYNFASTIAGFIITDVPVISMSPQSVIVHPLDVVTLSGYAVGVPPLAYQWYKDGKPIPRAQSASYTFVASPLTAGKYTLQVTNSYGSATSDASVVTISLPPIGPYKPAKVASNPYLM